MPAETSTRTLRLWTGLVVVAIFLVGAATGAGATHWFRPGGPFGHPGHGASAFPPPGAPPVSYTHLTLPTKRIV